MGQCTSSVHNGDDDDYDVTVRALTTSMTDVALVLPIELEHRDSDATTKSVLVDLRNYAGWAWGLVNTTSGELRAYCYVTPPNNAAAVVGIKQAHVDWIAVAKQGRHDGATLWKVVEHDLSERGIDGVVAFVTLDTSRSEESARRMNFWTAQGFRAIGVCVAPDVVGMEEEEAYEDEGDVVSLSLFKTLNA
jgi:hypothetical protein